MSFSGVVKEKIARTIGEYFSTNSIVNVFDDANIPTDRDLFAKWRITLDAFSKMSDPEAAIPHILKVFCHPLHFQDPQVRINFIEKLNTILAYENLKIRATDKGAEVLTEDGLPVNTSQIKKPVLEDNKQKQKPRSHNGDDESYEFKNGMPYAGCSLELFIARKILDKKTRPIFSAKEFSFKQHSYAEICFVINSFIEKGILSLYPNTTPEDLTYDDEKDGEETGLDGMIRYSVVKRVEKDLNELKWAGFDFEMEDEVKLRGLIEIGTSEFMNDKRYNEHGYLTDLSALSSGELSYEQQKDLVLRDIKNGTQNEVLINISDYLHPKVDIVRTLLSLEREGVLRVKEFSWEYRKNPRIGRSEDGPNNIKEFDDKDEVYAKVRLIQQPHTAQEIKITAWPEMPVRFVGETPIARDKKRESPIELSFPEPVQWKKVMLKIKEGRQEVEIFYDNSHIITADYRQLRFFVGKKQQKPDRQWGFLCALSTLSATDIKQATAENMRSMITENKTLSVNNVQQTKKLFAERLKEIFKTTDDPFNDGRGYYHPKFAILPEPALRGKEIWSHRLKENRSHEPKFISGEDSETSSEDDKEETL